jgi:hypothetical protein
MDMAAVRKTQRSAAEKTEAENTGRLLQNACQQRVTAMDTAAAGTLRLTCDNL